MWQIPTLVNFLLLLLVPVFTPTCTRAEIPIAAVEIILNHAPTLTPNEEMITCRAHIHILYYETSITWGCVIYRHNLSQELSSFRPDYR